MNNLNFDMTPFDKMSIKSPQKIIFFLQKNCKLIKILNS